VEVPYSCPKILLPHPLPVVSAHWLAWFLSKYGIVVKRMTQFHWTCTHHPSKGLGLDGSLSHSSTCCFHNASCSGYLCSSDHVSFSKSAWCSLHSGMASFTFWKIEAPIQRLSSLWIEGKKEQTQPDKLLPIPIAHIVIYGVSTVARAHILGAWSSCIKIHPATFGFFTICPAHPFCPIEGKWPLAWCDMSGEVKLQH